MSSLRLLPLIAVIAALAVPAVAEERQTQSPSEQPPATTTETAPAPAARSGQTMKDLLEEGYEIRAASVVPQDVVTRAGSTTSVDATFILLEKGSAVAFCYPVFSSMLDGSFLKLSCAVYN